MESTTIRCQCQCRRLLLPLTQFDLDSNWDTPLGLPSPVARSNFYKNKGEKRGCDPIPLRSYPPLIFPDDTVSSHGWYSAISPSDQEPATNGSISGDNRGIISTENRAFDETDHHESGFHGLWDNVFVHNPMPLRSYHPKIFPKVGGSSDQEFNIETHQVDTSLGLGLSSSNVQTSVKPARQKNIPPPDNGTRPEFLYGEWLEESDTKQDQNRVFVTDERARRKAKQ